MRNHVIVNTTWVMIAPFFYLICTGTSSGGVSPTRKEQPLFTLRQVGMICERLLKEREEKVREEYEETMTSKLAGWLTVSIKP